MRNRVILFFLFASVIGAAFEEPALAQASPAEIQATSVAQSLSKDESVSLAQPYPLERYQPLLEGNPFILIKTENDVIPDFARNLSILGIMRTGGRTTALLFDSETRTRLTVGETPDPVSGIQIESVALAAKPEDVSIQLVKGSQRGMVRFNRDAMALAASGGAAASVGAPNASPGGVMRSTQANPGNGQNVPQPRIIRRPIRRAEPIPAP